MISRWGLALLALAALEFAAPQADAFEARTFDVHRSGSRYVVELRAHLDAPPDRVAAVLLDYENYPKLDPRILESRREANDPNRLYTRLRGCLGSLLCRSMRRVETLSQEGNSLTASAIPAQSDVRYGLTQTQWEAHGSGTEVRYRLEIEPDFWVPPLFGPRLMVKTLREGTLELFQNVEREAQDG